MRTKKLTCAACGLSEGKIGEINDIDYIQFCGGSTPNWEQLGLLEGGVGHRITAKVSPYFHLLAQILHLTDAQGGLGYYSGHDH